MAQDIKGLIEKIQKEGIQAAEAKAREIENTSLKKTEGLLEKARKEAEGIIARAKEEAAKKEASTQALLRQAARDMLLSLKDEINAMLHRLVLAEVQQGLKPEELSRLVSSFIKEQAGKSKEEIIISLSPREAHKLEGFIAGLKETLKRDIVLRPSEDLHAGFRISFDAGKSCFDFSDQALAEYIGLYLKPKLNQLLQEAVEEE